MTVVTDLRSGRILHAVEGKSKEDITPFLRRLAKRGKALEGVAMDMSSAYYHAVREILPRVDIVFDRYHIMALMNGPSKTCAENSRENWINWANRP